jgi:hypothetical protein
MVGHSCNPSNSGGEDQEFKANPVKSSGTTSQQTSQGWWFRSVILAMGHSEVEDLSLKPAAGKNMRPDPENN